MGRWSCNSLKAKHAAPLSSWGTENWIETASGELAASARAGKSARVEIQAKRGIMVTSDGRGPR